MVAIEVAAEKATLLPKLGRPRMKLSVHANQTLNSIQPLALLRANIARSNPPVRIGDFHRWLTLPKKRCPGMPPSLAKAYIILELEVIEKVLSQILR